jgi:pimeloyl-ACP methyl ester carboxylesterase
MSEEENAWFGRLEELWVAKDWAKLSDIETLTWTSGVGQPEDRTPPELRARVREWIYDSYTRTDGESSPRLMEPPAVGRLNELKCPLLVIIGELDTSGTREAADVLAASVPQARKVMFNNVAHMPNLEKPDEFNATLRAFLAENSL